MFGLCVGLHRGFPLPVWEYFSHPSYKMSCHNKCHAIAVWWRCLACDIWVLGLIKNPLDESKKKKSFFAPFQKCHINFEEDKIKKNFRVVKIFWKEKIWNFTF